MSEGYQTSHGKVRPPDVGRLSNQRDHGDGANARDRARDHEPDGRFKRGNAAAKGSGAVRTVRGLVPPRGRRLFDAVVRQIGGEAGPVAAMHAADAVRHQLAAADLGELAHTHGLDTPQGKDLDERSTRHSEAGLRAVVAAMEAARLFRKPGVAKRPKGPPPGFQETP